MIYPDYGLGISVKKGNTTISRGTRRKCIKFYLQMMNP